MKLIKVKPDSDERCETCRYFVRHYVKIPFAGEQYIEANDGYCIQARRKNVHTDKKCERYKGTYSEKK